MSCLKNTCNVCVNINFFPFSYLVDTLISHLCLSGNKNECYPGTLTCDVNKVEMYIMET